MKLTEIVVYRDFGNIHSLAILRLGRRSWVILLILTPSHVRQLVLSLVKEKTCWVLCTYTYSNIHMYMYIYIYIHTCIRNTHTYTILYTISYILYTYIWHMNATILIGFPDVAFPKGLVASHDGCSLARSRFSTTGLTPPWTNHLPILSGSIASLLCLYTFCRQIWKQYFPFCFQPVKPSDSSSKQMLWWVLQLDIFTLTDRRTPALPPHDSRLTVIRPVEVHTTQGAPHLTCQPLEQTVLWQPTQ